MRRWRTWLARTLAVVGGMLVALLLAECGIAWLRPQADIYLYEQRDGYVFNRPGFDNRFAMVPQSWRPGRDALGRELPDLRRARHIRTNSLGQRDDHVPAFEDSAAGPRVLHLGDSMAFGWPVAVDQGYAERLEARLAGSEAINCAVIGACPAEFTRIYELDCSRFQVDVVVAQITIHDRALRPDCILSDRMGPDITMLRALRRRIGRRAYDLIERDAAGDARLAWNRLDGDIRAALHEAFEPRLPGYHSLHLVRLIENRWLAPDLLIAGHPFELENVIDGRPVDAGFEPPRVDQAPSAFAGPTLRWLRNLRRQVEGRRARLIVLFMPTSYRARALAAGDDSRPDVAWLKWQIRNDGVALADAEPLLGRGDVAATYVADDYHPNADGYDRVAALLAGVVQERPL